MFPTNTNALAPDWRRANDAEPAALRDVLVSVQLPAVPEGQTYLAWRQQEDPSAWFISGTEQRLPGTVYAWAPCGDPAPLPPPASTSRHAAPHHRGEFE